jgi:hypothetical protein
MGKVIHVVAAAPILALLVGLSLLLVGGLLISAWVERRRRRRLSLMVARMRKAPQRSNPSGVRARLKRVLEQLRAGMQPVRYHLNRFKWPIRLSAMGGAIALVLCWQVHLPEAPPSAAARSRSSAEAQANDRHQTDAQDTTLRLWYTNFATDQRQPADIYAYPVRLWGVDPASQTPVPITVSQPREATVDWHLPSSIDQSWVRAIHPDDITEQTPVRKLPPAR